LGVARWSSAAEEPEAALAPGGADPTLTRAGEVIGTPAYMAPEQARGEVHKHGPATDVYALGALLYHVLAGRPPRAAPRPQGSDADPDLLEGLEDAPPELRAVCRRATAAEPEARYPDAGALAAEITAFLDGAQRRERALAALERARAQGAALLALRARAEDARTQARKALSAVRPSERGRLGRVRAGDRGRYG
jgi:serine/threonine-protein kinase